MCAEPIEDKLDLSHCVLTQYGIRVLMVSGDYPNNVWFSQLANNVGTHQAAHTALIRL